MSAGGTSLADATGRIEELEIRVAHLDRGLQELSDVVVAQQAQLAQLVRRCEDLQQRLSAAQEPGEPDAATRLEIPPHY